ncbi:MAG: hypothetical protein ACLTL8_09500 [Bifidobacterium pseudocatenulatum]
MAVGDFLSNHPTLFKLYKSTDGRKHHLSEGVASEAKPFAPVTFQTAAGCHSSFSPSAISCWRTGQLWWNVEGKYLFTGSRTAISGRQIRASTVSPCWKTVTYDRGAVTKCRGDVKIWSLCSTATPG